MFTPIWARRLDAAHILDYRARQAWSFVLAVGLFAVATIAGQSWLFWVGALALGAAFAGGKLGWNLGHNDFASDDQSTLYMGIHVTLTGISRPDRAAGRRSGLPVPGKARVMASAAGCCCFRSV